MDNTIKLAHHNILLNIDWYFLLMLDLIIRINEFLNEDVEIAFNKVIDQTAADTLVFEAKITQD
jgi:hypothetical protein